MSGQASRFIGSIPEHYDQGLGPRIFFDFADDLARRASNLQPASVLELAAGTGIVTRRLRDTLANECELVATDLNMPMLEVAKTKFQSSEKLMFRQTDAMDLEFDEASFDLVVCQFGVMFFPDKLRSYCEVHRVLQPNGSYLFNVWDSWDTNPFAQVTHDVVTRIFPEDTPGFYQVPFSYHDEAEIRESLLQAGFSKINIEHMPLISSIRSAKEFAKGLVFGNPLYEEIGIRGGDPQMVCDAVAKAIDERLGKEMPLKAFVIEAVKS